MALTPPTTAPLRTMSQTDFDAAVAARIAWDTTNVSELTAFQAALTSIAAGTAFAIPYTFSTTTTDADPGAGFLRLSSATQNASTVIRADLAGADGSTWTSVLDTFDDSTSNVKGQLLLVKLGDATKWLAFNVTALASPSGYKNITVTPVASSSTSPFSNNDALVMKFTRCGDKGDIGAAIAAYLKVRDEKASGTNGGNIASGEQTRTLNTVVTNEISGASLASNKITLPAGTYQIRARVPAYNAYDHRAYLYNFTDSTYTILGSSCYITAGTNDSIISGQFTIASSKDFVIKHYGSTAVTNGLGWPVTSGQVEVYTEVEIWKIS